MKNPISSGRQTSEVVFLLKAEGPRDLNNRWDVSILSEFQQGPHLRQGSPSTPVPWIHSDPCQT